MPTQLIFSFDSEDYETPAGDGAERWWAEAMSRHGLTVCICVVGELARALRQRGRVDVIAAMARHQIAYHSNLHSAYPTWAEYLDGLSWDDGVARVLREEGPGIADVAEIFGQHPAAWCKPGNSWGPPVAQAMRQMDITVFADSPLEAAKLQPWWFANCLALYYHIAFDHYFNVPHEGRLERMQRDFEAKLAEHEGGYLIMYTHPCRLFTTRFTSSFSGGRCPPREQWRPSPLRPAQEIAELQQDFDAFLAWVACHPEVEMTTYRDLLAAHREPAAPWLPLRELLQPPDAPLDVRRVHGATLTPAEQFGMISFALAHWAETGKLPERVPVRRLLGPTAAPPAAPAGGPAALPDFAAAARAAEAACASARAVPAAIPVGPETIGPNTYLQSAWRLLPQLTEAAPDSVAIAPADEYPALAHSDGIREMRFNGTWTEYSPDFEGRNVLEMIRLQTWSAKPAELSR